MNRVVLITGASRGLGLALAGKFLDSGDRVYGVSKTKRYIKSAMSSVPRKSWFSIHPADLTSESQVKKFVQTVLKKSGRVDILINNAGYGGSLSRVEDLDQKEFKKMLDANLASAFLMSKYLIPLFRKQNQGMIVNISSMAGQRAVPKLFAYSASKFGMVALSQCLAKENEDKNIKSFAVCPGGINTAMRAGLFGKKEAGKQQSADFVADIVYQAVEGKIEVESGGDIVVRHGKITAIHSCPGV